MPFRGAAPAVGAGCFHMVSPAFASCHSQAGSGFNASFGLPLPLLESWPSAPSPACGHLAGPASCSFHQHQARVGLCQEPAAFRVLFRLHKGRNTGHREEATADAVGTRRPPRPHGRLRTASVRLAEGMAPAYGLLAHFSTGCNLASAPATPQTLPGDGPLVTSRIPPFSILTWPFLDTRHC